MTDPETPDEAYEQLSDQIEELEQFLGFGAERPGLGYPLSVAQVQLLIGQLRELRARRVAMGREPDDEVNAPVDMCCCNDWPRPPDYEPEPQFADGCPLHPRPCLCGLPDTGSEENRHGCPEHDPVTCPGCGSHQCICDFFDDGECRDYDG